MALVTGEVHPFTYKLGKAPRKFNKKTLTFSKYVDPVLPTPPATVNWESRPNPGTIGMYGNDTIGDCVAAEIAHHLMCITANAGKMIVPTEKEVIAMYSAISGYVPGKPDTDRGAAITDGLNYWHTHGLAGHKILGWAQINPNNVMHRKQAVWLFGGCSMGINLPYSSEDQFSAGLPWTVVPQDGGIAGGHNIYLSGYTAANENVASWGRGNQKKSYEWDAVYCDELYCVLTSDWIERASGLSPSGFNYANLMVDLKAIAQ